MRSYAVRGGQQPPRGLDVTYTPGAIGKVQQDLLRRVVLRERDMPGGLDIALIATVCRFSLDAGYHVILEGILTAARYGPMLRQLAADHRGRTSFFYLDVPFEETVRRHATRPQASEFTPEDMRGWYAFSELSPMRSYPRRLPAVHS